MKFNAGVERKESGVRNLEEQIREGGFRQDLYHRSYVFPVALPPSRETLLAELKRDNHHMTSAAKALGLERSRLYKKCQHLGIDLRALRKSD